MRRMLPLAPSSTTWEELGVECWALYVVWELYVVCCLELYASACPGVFGCGGGAEYMLCGTSPLPHMMQSSASRLHSAVIDG